MFNFRVLVKYLSSIRGRILVILGLLGSLPGSTDRTKPVVKKEACSCVRIEKILYETNYSHCKTYPKR